MQTFSAGGPARLLDKNITCSPILTHIFQCFNAGGVGTKDQRL